MASSEVDQKFLGKLAKAVEHDNPLLASMLFKILGLSLNLSQQLVQARKLRQKDPTRPPQQLDLYFHIIWLSREGLIMLEQYVLPVVGQYVELKVLAYKLRASFYHIFVLFYNQPPVSYMGLSSPEIQGPSSAEHTPPKGHGGMGSQDKNERAAHDDDEDAKSTRSSLQPTHPMEGGPVHPPPGFGPEPPAAFLLPATDYLPMANRYFKEAVAMSDELLWGSHSLRLSVKTEYAAFLYECAHDAAGSRKLAKDTISEVYEASEGIDNDMFTDACELVTILGKMMKRGLNTSTSSRTARGSSAAPAQQQQQTQHPQQSPNQPRQERRQPQQQQQQQQQHQRQHQSQQQQQRQQRVSSSVPRTTIPPPIPATTSGPQPPFEGVEFI